MVLLFVCELFDEFAKSIWLQSAGVAFVCINVCFKIEAFVYPDDDVVEGGCAVAVDLHFHGVEMFDAIEGRIIGVHVNVWLGADDAFVHFEIAIGPHEHAAWSSYYVTRHFDRDIESESDSVCESEFNLVELAAWPKNA